MIRKFGSTYLKYGEQRTIKNKSSFRSMNFIVLRSNSEYQKLIQCFPLLDDLTCKMDLPLTFRVQVELANVTVLIELLQFDRTSCRDTLGFENHGRFLTLIFASRPENMKKNLVNELHLCHHGHLLFV
jgi:hypothetical protein